MNEWINDSVGRYFPPFISHSIFCIFCSFFGGHAAAKYLQPTKPIKWPSNIFWKCLNFILFYFQYIYIFLTKKNILHMCLILLTITSSWRWYFGVPTSRKFLHDVNVVVALICWVSHHVLQRQRVQKNGKGQQNVQRVHYPILLQFLRWNTIWRRHPKKLINGKWH
jgi:hypothetical protein